MGDNAKKEELHGKIMRKDNFVWTTEDLQSNIGRHLW